MNFTHFYTHMVEDNYWESCTETTLGMIKQHRFFNLLSGRPYRFRVKQVHRDPNKDIGTPYSWPKILATTVPKEWRKHEFVNFHLRGTGLNNHEASYFKIDDFLSDITRLGGVRWDALKIEAIESDYMTRSWYGPLTDVEKEKLEIMRDAQLTQGDMGPLPSIPYQNVLLDHAFYIGLYLAIIDRRDLTLVEHNFYNTSAEPEEIMRGNFTTRNDFEVANEMARRIREYDYNYFVVIVSQYMWE